MASFFSDSTFPPDADVELVEKFLVSDPLYRRLELDLYTLAEQTPASALLPQQVSRTCERCKYATRWDRVPDNWEKVGSFVEARYRCRNCGAQLFHVWFLWAQADQRTILLKVGHFPRLQIQPRAALAKALDADKLSLYRTGMTMRHNNYGIGAMPYFRRLVENSTDEMLDLLIEALKAPDKNDPAIEKVQAAKREKVFDKKVEIAAALLPAHLRPGGVNPFGLLHDLLSDGLHARSEEECCEIVDGIDEALAMIYTTLKEHVRESQSYAEAMKKLQSKLGDRRNKP